MEAPKRTWLESSITEKIDSPDTLPGNKVRGESSLLHTIFLNAFDRTPSCAPSL